MNVLYNSMFGLAELNIQHRNKRVSNVNVKTGLNFRGILNQSSKLSPKKIIPYLERIEQSSHHHYSLCFCMLVEDVLGIIISDKLSLLRTAFLELERIYSHSLQLSQLFNHIQMPSVSANLSSIKNAIIDCMQNITGHRMYSSAHIPGGIRINFTAGNLELFKHTINLTEQKINKICDVAIDNLSLISLFDDIAVVSDLDIQKHKVSGPLAWCSGVYNDLRLKKPYWGYLNSEIKTILSLEKINYSKNSAYYRTVILLDDIKKSLNILSLILKQDLSYDYRPITLKSNLPVGRFEKSIETPRGEATMVFKISSGSYIINAIELVTASDVNFNILNSALKGTLVDFVQIAIDSLYLSIMEIDK